MGIAEVSGDLRRAVFLDRDGVLNYPVVRNGKPYPPASLEEFNILPDVDEAIDILRNLGLWICVVTNQPDVARGTQKREVIESMHAVLREKLLLNEYYVCYHDDCDSCSCRKPKPGLLRNAAADHGISLSGSYMVGDRWRDIDCGNSAGCTTIFIDRGYTEPLRSQPHYRAPDLRAAARLISLREGIQ